MIILIELIIGLVLLILPLLRPLTLLFQKGLACFSLTGVRRYSYLTIRNHHRAILKMQLSLVFGYTVILFLDTIATSQASMLIINLKFYYGSAFSITPSRRSLPEVKSLLSSLQSDPWMSGLDYAYISTPLEGSPSILSIGQIQEQPLRLYANRCFCSIIFRIAASPSVFDVMFHEWVEEGSRSQLFTPSSSSSSSLSSSLSDMDTISQSKQMCTFLSSFQSKTI